MTKKQSFVNKLEQNYKEIDKLLIDFKKEHIEEKIDSA